ncbi:MAG: 3'-5' exonuclease [Staphylococcus equorum]|uniref:DNA polymerase III polC-type n=1 Tax=Alkalibacterium gilvum TaxID=1130080 RepID=A0A1H6VJP7_9LACT|nr:MULTISPECIES: 3'-5' exonuclease [Alkalibacterium]MDN6741934.1 3'-5' exonuclease [Staphylococcus equorum]MDN6294373.1 3'-5' exonuclease [Alkalibacterium sp.]MDN6296044.1 3'-5' exonuclease [Alkalibacterium sp.]SEJ04818.1 DNA polymerase-3 subunit epsilon [Alkalibacterium gilvum]HAJ69977.1 exonuclease [Alkalibacterium sp.]
MNFTAIDFETANRQSHSACSVALTVVKDSKIVDEYYTLIQPETWFDRMNISIHGISEADVFDAPKFPDVWHDMKQFFTPEQLVVAHNMPFDKRILTGTLDYYGVQAPRFKTLCTVQSSRSLLRGLPNHKLNTVAKYYGIPLNHHHALDDSRASATILINQEREYGTSALHRFIK